MRISEEQDKKLGHVAQQVSDEFGRRMAEFGTAGQAARCVVVYVDGLMVVHSDDRSILATLKRTKAHYQAMTLET